MVRHPTFYTRRHMLALSVGLGATTLTGCNLVHVEPPDPGMVWVVGLDVTASVPLQKFLVMRQEMIPTLVLARARREDSIHLMPIDSDPEQRLVQATLTRNVALDKEIMPLYEAVQRFKRRDECPPPVKGQPRAASQLPAGCPAVTQRPAKVTQRPPEMWTNIGGILAYSKRLGLTLQAAHQRAIARGTPAPPMPRVVVIVLTDGKPEGPQTPLPPGPWPPVDAWFFGVEPAHIASLETWARTTMGFADPHISRFADWQNVAATAFGPQIDRPDADADLLKRLGVTPQVTQH